MIEGETSGLSLFLGLIPRSLLRRVMYNASGCVMHFKVSRSQESESRRIRLI